MIKVNFANDPFMALLDAAVDGIVVIDKSGLIQIINAAATRLFGYDDQELLGKNVKILMPPHDRNHHDDYLGDYLKTGERKMIGIGRETLGQKKDLSYFPMYLSVGNIDANSGSRFVGIIRDLTAQHLKEQQVANSEAEVRQLRDSLIHVARVSTLGEMVTGIAHEVNQPLTAIATYAQGCSRMIKAGLEEPRELLEALNKISSEAERAAKVITKIRQFSKHSPVVREAHDCYEFIAEVVTLAEIHAKEMNVSIKLAYLDMEGKDLEGLASDASEPKALMVVVDVIQVQQVVLNLVNNAIESMAQCEGDKVVTVRVKREVEEMVEIAISDRGEGVDMSKEDQLFEAFFTTKTSGLGIGLSICQSLVVAQGGKIRYSRNSDKGSTFYFTLPMAIGVGQ